MCESGRVLHHLRHHIRDEQTMVVLVGFQAENTLGRKLQDGQPWVRIYGETFSVRAKVETIYGFSAHADRSDLLWWIGQMRSTLRQTFVVHGETHMAETLADALRETGIKNVMAPQPGDTVQL
jgi:metallo-beta-lactamase family protein